MNATALPLATRRAGAAAPALLACYLIWGSTYLAIRFALEAFRPSSRWAPASSPPARC